MGIDKVVIECEIIKYTAKKLVGLNVYMNWKGENTSYSYTVKTLGLLQPHFKIVSVASV